MNGAQASGEGAVEGEGDELTAACTGRAEGIMYNRSMALRVGAEKLSRLSPKFIEFPNVRIRERSSSGHLLWSLPQPLGGSSILLRRL